MYNVPIAPKVAVIPASVIVAMQPPSLLSTAGDGKKLQRAVRDILALNRVCLRLTLEGCGKYISIFETANTRPGDYLAEETIQEYSMWSA
jgi:hypothetical protein